MSSGVWFHACSLSSLRTMVLTTAVMTGYGSIRQGGAYAAARPGPSSDGMERHRPVASIPAALHLHPEDEPDSDRTGLPATHGCIARSASEARHGFSCASTPLAQQPSPNKSTVMEPDASRHFVVGGPCGGWRCNNPQAEHVLPSTSVTGLTAPRRSRGGREPYRLPATVY
jgi:hypothetical protein